MIKEKHRYWVESLPDEKHENAQPSVSLLNKNHELENCRFEVLPSIDYLCSQQIPNHKTQHLDFLTRYHGGFETKKVLHFIQTPTMIRYHGKKI